MTLKESIEVQDAFNVSAYFDSFDGNLEKWKDSFYQIWRFQMTWGFAHHIALYDTRDRGVYLDMLVKPAYKSQVVELMDELGYRDIKAEHENIGAIEYVSDDFLDQFIRIVVVD